MVEPADVANDWLENVAQPEPFPQGLLIRVFIFDFCEAVLPPNMRILLRIPDIVIDAIEDAADFTVMDIQRVGQAEALAAIHDLPGISRRNSGHEIGINNSALHHVDCGMMARVLQTILVKKIAGPV